ncbi:MAG: Ppx/GppA family phosphatase [Halanaerobiales bacterium]
MRIGAIDLGTNSCRMLLADYSQGKVKEVKKELRIVRLGEGVDRNRHLSTEAAERALQVILEFVEEMKAHSVEAITIIGTSALRDVNNAFLLAERIREKTGLELNIISGAEEARLNYLGAGLEGDGNLVLDIGGGSTEFIWQDEGGKLNYRSLDMGAVRMTERHIRDVEKEISAEELQLIEEDVRRTMEGKLKDIPVNIHRAVGLGGTITTLAAIDQGLEEYDSARIHGYLLHRKQIEGILQRLAELNLQERRKIRGLEPGRADIITAGTKILATIMDILVIESVRASEQDLLYGAIIKLAESLV